MARPIAKHDNTDIKNMLVEQGFFDYNELPRWMDDCISGATTQVAGTQRYSPANLFNILRTLDELSTETVGSMINRKRIAFGDEPFSDRYVQYVTKAARCASQALSHHVNHVITSI